MKQINIWERLHCPLPLYFILNIAKAIVTIIKHVLLEFAPIIRCEHFALLPIIPTIPPA